MVGTASTQLNQIMPEVRKESDIEAGARGVDSGPAKIFGNEDIGHCLAGNLGALNG